MLCSHKIHQENISEYKISPFDDKYGNMAFDTDEAEVTGDRSASQFGERMGIVRTLKGGGGEMYMIVYIGRRY